MTFFTKKEIEKIVAKPVDGEALNMTPRMAMLLGFLLGDSSLKMVTLIRVGRLASRLALTISRMQAKNRLMLGLFLNLSFRKFWMTSRSWPGLCPVQFMATAMRSS